MPRKPSDRRQNRVTKDVAGLALAQAGGPQGLGMVSIPVPPVPIKAKVRRYWEAFWQSEVAQVISPNADAHILVRWLTYLQMWEDIAASLRREGTDTEGSQGQKVQHPDMKSLQWLDSAIFAIEKELGLTPKARATLGLAVNAYKASAADLMAAIPAMEPVLID